MRVHVGLLALGCLTLISCLTRSDGDATTTATTTPPESPSGAGAGHRTQQMMRSSWYNVSHFAAINMTSEEEYYFNIVCGRGHYDDGPRPRQEYRTLSDKQRWQLHDAFNRMRNTTVPGKGGRTEYQVFVGYHRFSSSPGAHFGPAFVLWHREYIVRLERGLQKHDPLVMLPYFDSSLDAFLPEPKDSAVWTSEYLGNNDDLVTTGFASNWTIYPAQCMLEYDTLYRSTLANSSYLLYNDLKINSTVYRATSFKALFSPYNLSDFEDNHGSVHVFIGGQMSYITCSPNDPFFFLHHSFVDYLYEIFRRESQTTPRETEYPDDDGQIPLFHGANDTMYPFREYMNRRGLSDDYTNLYYNYAPSPRQCCLDTDCRSEVIWCDTVDGRCKAKVREGGYCAQLPDRACYVPKCKGLPKNVSGYCRCA